MMHTAQFRSMIWNAVNGRKPIIAGPGVSATYHYVLMHHTYMQLSWLLFDGSHTTSMSSVPH